MIRIIRFIFFILFSLYVAMFAATNRQKITIELVPDMYSLVTTISILVMASALFGFFLGRSYYSSSKRNLKKQCAEKDKQITRLKEDIAQERAGQATSLMIQ